MTKYLVLLLFMYGCGKPIVEGPVQTVQKSPLAVDVNEEILLSTKMSMNFDLLPLRGTTTRNGKLWSGDSWRLNRGAINLRWNSPDKEGFNYLSPTEREMEVIPEEMIKKLSPSEKYDLYMGRYDYPLKMEVDLVARSGTQSWEGLCHGWAGASLNHEEPGPITVTNPDGIEIYFGSADLKALLSYAYSKVLIKPQDNIGKRCERDVKGLDDEDTCDNDLTAQDFHVVITNKIGLRGQSLIADIDRFKEVWNHPITGYDMKVEKMVSSPKDGRTTIIKAKITYVEVAEKNSWVKQLPIYSQMTVRYRLDLDKNGNIVDGKWLSRERPDFIWTVDRAKHFDEYLDGIFKLVK